MNSLSCHADLLAQRLQTQTWLRSTTRYRTPFQAAGPPPAWMASGTNIPYQPLFIPENAIANEAAMAGIPFSTDGTLASWTYEYAMDAKKAKKGVELLSAFTPNTYIHKRDRDGNAILHCTHGLVANLLQVKGNTPNKGRWYAVCPLQRHLQCKMFVWMDEAHQVQHETKPLWLVDEQSMPDTKATFDAMGLSREHIPASALPIALRMLHKCDRCSEKPDAAWNGEQRTSEWFDARNGVDTASVSLEACGLSRYKTPLELARTMLWPMQLGGAALQWGSTNEDVVLDDYVSLMNTRLPDAKASAHGIWINAAFPFMGASPDGIVRNGDTVWGIEIKCPYKYRNRKHGEPFYAMTHLFGNWRGCVPDEYFAQMQHQAFVLGLPWIDFVAYTPTGIMVTRVPYNPAFVEGILFPRHQLYYSKIFLPLLACREAGSLEMGSVVPSEKTVAASTLATSNELVSAGCVHVEELLTVPCEVYNIMSVV